MDQRMRSSLISARTLMAVVWGILCVCILAAPVLAANAYSNAAAFFYLSFSCVCHQIPERSFMISGHAWAVCHRCSGIYLGLFLAAAFARPFLYRSARARRNWALAAIVPLLLDAILPYAGLWHSTNLSRFLTGMLFGILTSSLLVRGVSELLQEAPWRRFSIRVPHFKGGLS